MPRPTIDYLNARRDAARKGKAIVVSYGVDRRAQEHDMDELEALWRNFDRDIQAVKDWAAEVVSRNSGCLAPGETLDDLVF